MIDLGGFQFEINLKAATNTKVLFYFIFLINLMHHSLK